MFKFKSLFMMVGVALVLILVWIGCGEDECNMVTSSGMPPIKCSGHYEKTISNITYDGMGRVMSYDYTLTCGGKTYSGHVNLKNGTITINGKVCYLY